MISTRLRKGMYMAEKTKKDKKEKQINVFESTLVPKQEVLTGDERSELIKNLGIHLKQLPKMRGDDPIVKILNAKKGDVIKIIRDPEGQPYYRVVVG